MILDYLNIDKTFHKKRQGTLPFLKIDRRHWRPLVKGPINGAAPAAIRYKYVRDVGQENYQREFHLWRKSGEKRILERVMDGFGQ